MKEEKQIKKIVPIKLSKILKNCKEIDKKKISMALKNNKDHSISGLVTVVNPLFKDNGGFRQQPHLIQHKPLTLKNVNNKTQIHIGEQPASVNVVKIERNHEIPCPARGDILVENEIQMKMKELMKQQLSKISENENPKNQNQVKKYVHCKKIYPVAVDGVLPNGDFIGFPYFDRKYREEKKKLQTRMKMLSKKHKIEFGFSEEEGLPAPKPEPPPKPALVVKQQVKATKIPKKVLDDVMTKLKKKPNNNNVNSVNKNLVKTEPSHTSTVIVKEEKKIIPHVTEKPVIPHQNKSHEISMEKLKFRKLIVIQKNKDQELVENSILNPAPGYKINELKLKKVQIGERVVLPMNSKSQTPVSLLAPSPTISKKEEATVDVPIIIENKLPPPTQIPTKEEEIDQKPSIFNFQVLSSIDQDLGKLKTCKMKSEEKETEACVRTLNKNKNMEDLENENIQMKLVLKMLCEKYQLPSLSDVCQDENNENPESVVVVDNKKLKNNDIVIHSEVVITNNNYNEPHFEENETVEELVEEEGEFDVCDMDMGNDDNNVDYEYQVPEASETLPQTNKIVIHEVQELKQTEIDANTPVIIEGIQEVSAGFSNYSVVDLSTHPLQQNEEESVKKPFESFNEAFKMFTRYKNPYATEEMSSQSVKVLEPEIVPQRENRSFENFWQDPQEARSSGTSSSLSHWQDPQNSQKTINIPQNSWQESKNIQKSVIISDPYRNVVPDGSLQSIPTPEIRNNQDQNPSSSFQNSAILQNKLLQRSVIVPVPQNKIKISMPSAGHSQSIRLLNVPKFSEQNQNSSSSGNGGFISIVAKPTSTNKITMPSRGHSFSIRLQDIPKFSESIQNSSNISQNPPQLQVGNQQNSVIISESSEEIVSSSSSNSGVQEPSKLSPGSIQKPINYSESENKSVITNSSFNTKQELAKLLSMRSIKKAVNAPEPKLRFLPDSLQQNTVIYAGYKDKIHQNQNVSQHSPKLSKTAAIQELHSKIAQGSSSLSPKAQTISSPGPSKLTETTQTLDSSNLFVKPTNLPSKIDQDSSSKSQIKVSSDLFSKPRKRYNLRDNKSVEPDSEEKIHSSSTFKPILEAPTTRSKKSVTILEPEARISTNIASLLHDSFKAPESDQSISESTRCSLMNKNRELYKEIPKLSQEYLSFQRPSQIVESSSAIKETVTPKSPKNSVESQSLETQQKTKKLEPPGSDKILKNFMKLSPNLLEYSDTYSQEAEKIKETGSCDSPETASAQIPKFSSKLIDFSKKPVLETFKSAELGGRNRTFSELTPEIPESNEADEICKSLESENIAIPSKIPLDPVKILKSPELSHILKGILQQTIEDLSQEKFKEADNAKATEIEPKPNKSESNTEIQDPNVLPGSSNLSFKSFNETLKKADKTKDSGFSASQTLTSTDSGISTETLRETQEKASKLDKLKDQESSHLHQEESNISIGSSNSFEYCDEDRSENIVIEDHTIVSSESSAGTEQIEIVEDSSSSVIVEHFETAKVPNKIQIDDKSRSKNIEIVDDSNSLEIVEPEDSNQSKFKKQSEVVENSNLSGIKDQCKTVEDSKLSADKENSNFFGIKKLFGTADSSSQVKDQPEITEDSKKQSGVIGTLNQIKDQPAIVDNFDKLKQSQNIPPNVKARKIIKLGDSKLLKGSKLRDLLKLSRSNKNLKSNESSSKESTMAISGSSKLSVSQSENQLQSILLQNDVTTTKEPEIQMSEKIEISKDSNQSMKNQTQTETSSENLSSPNSENQSKSELERILKSPRNQESSENFVMSAKLDLLAPELECHLEQIVTSSTNEKSSENLEENLNFSAQSSENQQQSDLELADFSANEEFDVFQEIEIDENSNHSTMNQDQSKLEEIETTPRKQKSSEDLDVPENLKSLDPDIENQIDMELQKIMTPPRMQKLSENLETPESLKLSAPQPNQLQFELERNLSTPRKQESSLKNFKILERSTLSASEPESFGKEIVASTAKKKKKSSKSKSENHEIAVNLIVSQLEDESKAPRPESIELLSTTTPVSENQQQLGETIPQQENRTQSELDQSDLEAFKELEVYAEVEVEAGSDFSPKNQHELEQVVSSTENQKPSENLEASENLELPVPQLDSQDELKVSEEFKIKDSNDSTNSQLKSVLSPKKHKSIQESKDTDEVFDDSNLLVPLDQQQKDKTEESQKEARPEFLSDAEDLHKLEDLSAIGSKSLVENTEMMDEPSLLTPKLRNKEKIESEKSQKPKSKRARFSLTQEIIPPTPDLKHQKSKDIDTSAVIPLTEKLVDLSEKHEKASLLVSIPINKIKLPTTESSATKENNETSEPNTRRKSKRLRLPSTDSHDSEPLLNRINAKNQTQSQERRPKRTRQPAKKEAEETPVKSKRSRKSVPEKAPEPQILDGSTVTNHPGAGTIPYKEITDLLLLAVVKKGRPTGSRIADKERERKELLTRLKHIPQFKCGKCNVKVEKTEWCTHIVEDKGLAWMEDFEPPLVIENFVDAGRRVQNMMKIYKIPFIACKICGDVKRSGPGVITHMYTCGQTEERMEQLKIECEYCGERIFPFYAQNHKKSCSIPLVTDVVQYEPVEESVNLDPNGKLKRKAVKKAEQKMKQILTSLDNPGDYVKKINQKFKCELCGKFFNIFSDAVDHVKQGHNEAEKNKLNYESDDDDESVTSEIKEGVESSEDDMSSGDEENSSGEKSGSDEEDLDTSKKPSRSFVKQTVVNIVSDPPEMNRARKVFSGFSLNLAKNPVHRYTTEWTRAFMENRKNNLRISFQLPIYNMQPEPSDYLCSLNYKKFSINYQFQRIQNSEKFSKYSDCYKTEEWQKVKILECCSEKESATLFCGSQVTSMDWAPSTSKDEDHYLAIACNVADNASVIQIWCLKNDIKNNPLCDFIYAIPVKESPIWSIKFYPMECDKNLIGVLAVSTGVGDIHLFNLPVQIRSNVILNLEPKYKFKLMERSHSNAVFRVNWSKGGCGEVYLAAGYVNGLVAVWDLNKINISEAVHYPMHVISAHSKCVTGLDFHFTENNVYLLTCSLDRKMKVFSITDAFPKEISSTNNRTRVLNAQFWTHWTCFLTGNDECYGMNCSNTQCQPHELYRTGSLLTSDRTITDVSLNNFLNAVLMASDNGDVIIYKMPQLAYFFGKGKNFVEKRKYLTVTDYCDSGLVFYDYKNGVSLKQSPVPQDFEKSDFVKINQVSFNNNPNSYKWYAVGYDVGIVRIRYFKE